MSYPINRPVCAVATALAALAALCVGCQSTPPPAAPEPEPVPPTLVYGLPADSFNIEKATVRQGQNFSQLLTSAGLPYAQALAAYNASSFDFRRMKAGGTCYLFRDPDTVSVGPLRHFVYVISPTDYVRCSFADSVAVVRESLPVDICHRTASARITSNLWNALAQQRVDPQVALDLSDIFAWSVDFFGLSEGDAFTLLFEEKMVGGQPIGTGNILAALYESASHHKQYAFRHVTDSVPGYYDLQGNSLRRAFLKAPLHFSRISSRFSHGRMHPVLKIRRPHHGVDYAAPAGTPVVAIGDGKVIAKGYDKKGGGNFLKIRHNSVYTTEYMHLQGFASGMAVGVQVRQGDQIGTVGATGLATGPHLDFRMFRDGQPIDPLKVELPPAEPMDNDEILNFMEESDRYKAVLDSVAALR